MMLTKRMLVAWLIFGIGFAGLFGPAVLETGMSEQRNFWIGITGAMLATAGIVLKSVLNFRAEDENSTPFRNQLLHITVVSLATFLLFLYIATEMYEIPF